MVKCIINYCSCPFGGRLQSRLVQVETLFLFKARCCQHASPAGCVLSCLPVYVCEALSCCATASRNPGPQIIAPLAPLLPKQGKHQACCCCTPHRWPPSTAWPCTARRARCRLQCWASCTTTPSQTWPGPLTAPCWRFPLGTATAGAAALREVWVRRCCRMQGSSREYAFPGQWWKESPLATWPCAVVLLFVAAQNGQLPAYQSCA